jgi:hypothetical protein
MFWARHHRIANIAETLAAWFLRTGSDQFKPSPHLANLAQER